MNGQKSAQLTRVSVYGEGLRVFTDSGSTDSDTTEAIVSTDTTTYSGRDSHGPYLMAAAIELDNDLTIMVGDEDGYGPLEIWIVRTSTGESIRHAPNKGLPSRLTIPDVG